MNSCSQFIELLRKHGPRDALIWKNQTYTFDALLDQVAHFRALFSEAKVLDGAIVCIEGDFSPAGVAALLVLIELKAIAVPLTPSVETKKAEFYATAEAEWSLKIEANDIPSLSCTGAAATNELTVRFRERGHAGLILFSSGSTGKSKAVLHDLELLLAKYLNPRHCYRTLAFLLFDHIGGIDTLFYNLANGSCLVTVPDHSPENVCDSVERHEVEVLPVSPTFLNLLLLSGALDRYALGSLRIITYGAEVMPESTLRKVSEKFPNVRLIQKFGTTEVGTLRSQSRESGSPWVRMGGEGYEVRVVQGLLEIKASSAMVGYLNAPDPFTDDGWFKTGDAVEVDGDYMRILGRKSEMINVGGEKVYPAEVEGVLMQIPGVIDASVTGEPNPITGSMVVAQVNLVEPEEPALFRKRMRTFCREHLASYKIPAKIEILSTISHSARFKKMRQSHSS